MKYMIKKTIQDESKNVCVEFDIADSFFRKLKGLMFKKEVQRPLMFFKCKQVHTFFMKIAIDLYYFDKDMKIIEIEKNLKANKIGRYVKGAYGVIESAVDCENFEIGDLLEKV